MNEQLALPILVPKRLCKNLQFCYACGQDTIEMGEWYGVHDHVWHVVPHEGVLCIACLDELALLVG
jgi:hypothetical protein